jgi:hypothetical protein
MTFGLETPLLAYRRLNDGETARSYAGSSSSFAARNKFRARL